MKYLLFISAVLALSACKKDKDHASAPEVPLIKRCGHFIQVIGQTITSYTYEKEKVLTQSIYDYIGTYTYLTNKVFLDQVRGNGSLESRETFDIDDKGYVFHKHATLLNTNYYYKIRPDGMLESEVKMDNGPVIEEKYYYSSTRLLDSSRTFQNNTLKIVTTYTEYDTTRPFTVDNENYGRPFIGRRFKHHRLN